MKLLIKIFFSSTLLLGLIQQVHTIHYTENSDLLGEYKTAAKNLLSTPLPSVYDISDLMKVKTIQKRSLSCEISAAADILSYYEDTFVSEDELLPLLDKSNYNTLPQTIGDKTYWGNPEEGFVGYIDTLPDGTIARQRLMTGYGVLEKPIENLFKRYGYKTVTLNQDFYTETFSQKQHLTFILKELERGNLSELWGDICTNPTFYSGDEHKCFYAGEPNWDKDRSVSWYYIDKNGEEQKYTGLIGEHIFYVLGYTGTPENPIDLIVWDTYTGRHIYPVSEWMRKWETVQFRSITIYKDSKDKS